MPHHVVIIPDGNRRWAKERGEEPWFGHEAGAKNTEALVKEAREQGVRELSFWGSSLENLSKRPVAETKALLRIYEEYFSRLLQNEDIHRDQARLRFIGRWREQFPEKLKKILFQLEEETKGYEQYGLNFFLAYSGDDDMRQAIQTISETLPTGSQVTDRVIKDALMTRELPPVDLLIRTGRDPHLSAGFMMWDIANAELSFSEKLFPDFGPEAFVQALWAYGERERRLGK